MTSTYNTPAPRRVPQPRRRQVPRQVKYRPWIEKPYYRFLDWLQTGHRFGQWLVRRGPYWLGRLCRVLFRVAVVFATIMVIVGVGTFYVFCSFALGRGKTWKGVR